MALFNETARILENVQVGPRLHLMVLKSPEIACSIEPGQFVHMKVPRMEAHILRRPFSVYARDAEEGTLDVLYQVVGFGTDHMTSLAPGEECELIGPVGATWNPPATGRCLLVGGGVGAAPLFMLYERIVASEAEVDVVLGAQTKDALVCRARYEALLGTEPRCATDDGSYGRAGFCTSLVEEALAEAQAAREEAQRRAEEEAARQAEEAARATEEAAAQERQEQEAESSGEAQSAEQEAQPPAEQPAVEAPSSDGADWSSDKATFVSEWAGRIDAYLAGSPLAGQGATFASAAWDYGVDPRWSPAISNTESSKGLYCFNSHNAWGWGSYSWGSWEEAIDAHVRGLARGYGYTISVEAAKKYCPPNWEHWYNATLAQMNMI